MIIIAIIIIIKRHHCSSQWIDNYSYIIVVVLKSYIHVCILIVGNWNAIVYYLFTNWLNMGIEFGTKDWRKRARFVRGTF